jgi:hypothetical protein
LGDARIRPDEPPSSGEAYLYGRFSLTRTTVGPAGYATLGFLIRCADDAAYTIRFALNKNVQVIRIRPSRCALDWIVVTDATDLVKASRQPPAAWKRVQEFAAGKAYYLGDYLAHHDVVGYHQYDRDIDSAEDNYEGTTAELKRTFSNLAAVSTENKLLIPRRHVPPGAIDPPGAAPLSPERIARIAPFTKRRFATVAECERLCPTGRCLPFREETGPAVTCIVRCTADKDCPEGLACNCPGDGRPDCHAITQTPEDQMDGICLSVEPSGPRR